MTDETQTGLSAEELQQQIDERLNQQLAVRDFSAHVERLQETYGVQLTEEGVQDLITRVQENGFEPEVTEQVFGAIVSEATEAGHLPDLAQEEEEEAWTADDEEPGEDEGFQNFQRDAEAELQRLEKKLDRKLLQPELEQLGKRMADDALRHDKIDAEAALNAIHEENGTKPTSEWTNNDWTRHAIERAHELNAAANPPDLDRVYDLDKHSDRAAWGARRLEGVPAEDLKTTESVAAEAQESEAA